jgi:DNA uptake protein ComE-like DNA-binding protein
MNKYGKYNETVRFYLVDVKEISSTIPRSNFNENELEQLANSVLITGCLLKPLLLRQTSPISYELLEGYLEYWAAVKAKEKEPILAEMVSAFVVKPEVETIAIEQAHVLNKTASLNLLESQLPTNTLEETRLNNLESRFEREFQEIKNLLKSQNAHFSQSAQKIDHVVNQLQELKIAQSRLEETIKQQSQSVKIKKSQKAIEQIESPELVSELLQALNYWDYEQLMKISGLNEEIARKLIKKREKENPFGNLQQIANLRIGFNKNIRQKIITNWKKFNEFKNL